MIKRTSLCLLFLYSVAQAQVSLLDAWTVDCVYEDQPSEDDNFTPSAGNNRIVIVMLSAESNIGTELNVANVHLGNQNLTQIFEFTIGDVGAYHNLNWVGYLLESGIDAMVGDSLRIDWTNAGNSPFDSASIHYATYENVDQGGGTSTIADTASNTVTSATSLALGSSLTSGTDDRILLFNVVGQHYNPGVSTGGYTEHTQCIGNTNGHASAAYHRTATTSTTETPTLTSATATRMAVSGFVLNFTAPPAGGTNAQIMGLQIID